MSKNILVTGGAGFIGSHLCEKLVENNTVICVDNLITGDIDNIKKLIKSANFRFVKHDISKPLTIGQKIDQIYHMASPASPIDYQKLPIETMMANSLGTFNMLNIAKKAQAKFLLASTSEVYGDPEKTPQEEGYWGHVNPTGPRSCYDESKRFAEALTMSFYRIHGTKVNIARIFNTYGPKMRENDGRAVPQFVMQALKNKPITIYGDGKQTRSFCYISDMVDGLIKVMDSRFSGEIFNLGHKNEMKIIDLAKMIKNMTKSSSEIVFGALPEDDPKKRRPDIRKAKRLIDWEPKVNIRDGLDKTIKWFVKGF